MSTSLFGFLASHREAAILTALLLYLFFCAAQYEYESSFRREKQNSYNKNNTSQHFALLKDATDVRKSLEHYFNLDGRIPWQDEYEQRAGRPR